MASRKDEKEEPEKKSAENSGRSGSSKNPQQRPEMQKPEATAAARSIDETKQNIREAMEEARKEIPRYNPVVNDYQNQTIDATRDITESYLDSQRQAINSMQSSWMQVMQQQQQLSWWGWRWGWGMPISPQAVADLYTKLAGSFADAAISATRMASKMMFANIEAAKTAMTNARDNTKEMARIATDFSGTFGQPASPRDARSRA
jgi:flagellar biosynthesis GTPase FlhF